MVNSRGFTLVELMIVVAILAILAALAIPQYNNYVSRTRASAAVMELAAYHSAIADCVNELQAVSGCNAGTNGIPAGDAPGMSNVIPPVTIADGKITATIKATSRTQQNLTIIDTPSLSEGRSVLSWSNSGTSCDTTRGFRPGQGHCP